MTSPAATSLPFGLRATEVTAAFAGSVRVVLSVALAAPHKETLLLESPTASRLFTGRRPLK